MIQVEIRWPINPFRGDRFAEGWLPGRRGGARLRRHAVVVHAQPGRAARLRPDARLFPSKAHFERYWYSERIAEFRIELAGCYQVPILPTYWESSAQGETVGQPCSSGAIVSPASFSISQ